MSNLVAQSPLVSPPCPAVYVLWTAILSSLWVETLVNGDFYDGFNLENRASLQLFHMLQDQYISTVAVTVVTTPLTTVAYVALLFRYPTVDTVQEDIDLQVWQDIPPTPAQMPAALNLQLIHYNVNPQYPDVLPGSNNPHRHLLDSQEAYAHFQTLSITLYAVMQ